jgi:hypothetical protein
MWAAGTLAAVALVCCVVAFTRAAYDGMIGWVARGALVAIGAAAAWVMFDAPSARDSAAEHRALNSRMTALTARAVAPGSALACLDGVAGETVEKACEKALFATPEAAAAAVSYVAAQLTLLADASGQAKRDASYANLAAQLRRAAEADRFGLVAHVLSVREGCTSKQCSAFALFKDASRVKANIADRTYETYVQRYATGWPSAGPPVASASPPAAITAASNAVSGLPLKPPGPDVFFPSADSIPPVSIMTAEPPAAKPQAHQETTGSANTHSAARPPPPPRKPAHPAPRPPVNLNADAVRAAPPATAQ